MNDYDHFMRFLDLPSNSKIDTACRYLESRGFLFLVDFGLDNAENLMWMDAENRSWGLQ